jgi:hypothetical protein
VFLALAAAGLFRWPRHIKSNAIMFEKMTTPQFGSMAGFVAVQHKFALIDHKSGSF